MNQNIKTAEPIRPVFVRVMNSVCKYYSVTRDEIMGDSLKSHIVFPRMIIMHILRKQGFPQSSIADVLHCCPSTAVHGDNYIQNRLICKERGFERLPEIIKTIEERAGLCAGPKTN